MEVRPFTIHVPDAVLDDLRRRLGETRFPDSIPGAG
jgi:microsomal epoxide hydrolase